MSDFQAAVQQQYEIVCREQFREIKKGQDRDHLLISQVRERVFNGLSDKMDETQREIRALRKTFIWFIVISGLGIATLIVTTFAA